MVQGGVAAIVGSADPKSVLIRRCPHAIPCHTFCHTRPHCPCRSTAASVRWILTFYIVCLSHPCSHPPLPLPAQPTLKYISSRTLNDLKVRVAMWHTRLGWATPTIPGMGAGNVPIGHCA